MSRRAERNLAAEAPEVLGWKCERCGGMFRLFEEIRKSYECDICGELGELAPWARRKLGLPA